MQVTTNIQIDFTLPGFPETVHAMQQDEATRYVAIAMTAGGQPFTPPTGTSGVLAILKPDGTTCYYDAVGDTPAVVLNGSTATCLLVPEALTAAGEAKAALVLYNSDGSKLTTFRFRLIVEETPVPDGVIESSSYYSILTQQIAQALAAAEAAQAVLDMTVSATTLAAGSQATVTKTTSGGVVNLAFGIPQGIQGNTGATGPQGPQGEAGVGVPVGGAENQVLTKASGTDYDTAWETLTPASIGAVSADEKGAAGGVATLNGLGTITGKQSCSPVVSVSNGATIGIQQIGQTLNASPAAGQTVTLTIQAGVFSVNDEFTVLLSGAGTVIVQGQENVQIRGANFSGTVGISTRYASVSFKKFVENSNGEYFLATGTGLTEPTAEEMLAALMGGVADA